MKWRFKRFMNEKGYFSIYRRALLLIMILIGLFKKSDDSRRWQIVGYYLLIFVYVMLISYALRFIYLIVRFILNKIKMRRDYVKDDQNLRQASQKRIKKVYEEIQSQTHYVSKKELETLMFETKFKKSSVGNMYLTDQEKTEGAMIVLTQKEIHKRQTYINEGIFTRDDELRRLANVNYFEDYTSFIEYKGKRHYLYQRTHLIPFRWSLSEGDNIDNLLVTATTKLNSGDDPTKHYLVPTKYDHPKNPYISHDYYRDLGTIGWAFNDRYDHFGVDGILREPLTSYKKRLFQRHQPVEASPTKTYLQIDSHEGRIRSLQKKVTNTPLTLDCSIPNFDDSELTSYFMSTQEANETSYPAYSLNDFEIVASTIIENTSPETTGYIPGSPYDIYVYGTICNYSDDDLIPASIDAFLINSTRKQMILSMRFHNHY